MSFWPSICRCEGCRRKVGKPVPEIIDWSNPAWVEFQRFREETMAQFAQELTDWCRTLRPDITVTHQFSPVLHGWALGQSSGIARASDYASGDFYGNKLQQCFAVKVFDAFTRCPPFEFMTSRCVDLHDHTSTKSPDEMFFSALTTLANGGAYFFIDAISPSGTLSEPFYQMLSKINQRLRPFKECVAALHPKLWAKVGLYFSMPSCVDASRNGVKLKALNDVRANNMAIRHNAVLDEAMGTAQILTKLHVPYRIITDTTTDFAGIKTIIVNNAAYLTASECRRLQKFVTEGGMLIATGATSLYSYRGDSTGNFALTDIFGVEFTGQFSQDVTYSGEECVLAVGKTPLVKTTGAEVRAYLTFPDFPPYDEEHYASIHSDPPSSACSEYPAVTWHTYGQGGCLWIASPILGLKQFTQQEFGMKLLSPLLPALVVGKENLPPSMEITLLKGDNEWLLCLVNWQNELPVIPLHNVTIVLQVPFVPEKATRIVDGTAFAFHFEKGILTLNFPKITEGEFISFGTKTRE